MFAINQKNEYPYILSKKLNVSESKSINNSYSMLANSYSEFKSVSPSPLRNFRSYNNYWDIKMCASKNQEEYKQPDN